MSEGKSIDIRIAATGGDKTADEIKKVGDASEVAGKKVGSLEKDSAPSGATDRAARLKEIAAATGAIGVAAGLATKAIGNVWEQIDKVDTADLRNLDSAMADQIENAKKLRTALEDPIGALAALANGGTTVKEAFDDLDEQMKLNGASQSSAVDRLLAKSDTQVKEIKRLAEEIKFANDLLKEQTALDRVVREGQNAEAIRNGADPDDILADEAKKRAEEDIAAVGAEQNLVRSGFQEKYDTAQESQRKADQAKAAAEKINTAAANAASTEAAYKNRSPNASSDEVWAMRNAALSAKSDFDYTKRTYSPQAQASNALQKKAEEDLMEFENQRTEITQVDAMADKRKAQIRVGRDNTVRDAGASKVSRIQEEEERAAGKAGRDAVSLIPPGVSGELKDAVKSVSRRLQNGDQGGELRELAGLLKEMAGSLAANDAQRAKDIAALKIEIASINQRQRNR